MGRRIGVLGGTFDPIHLGHLIVAEEVADRCRLDRVLFVPAAEPPHKRRPEISGVELRTRMVQEAIAHNSRFALSRVEVDRQGVSYTVDTLRLLRDEFGDDAELFLIVGRDSAEDMAAWSQPAELTRLAHVVVADRPGTALGGDPDLLAQMTFLDTTRLALSSTDVRRRVLEGRSIRYLVPQPVVDIINEARLYR